MKPALQKYFEDYGKKQGVALLNFHFKEMEGIDKKVSYNMIIKLSETTRPELKNERYLKGVMTFGKSHNYFPLKVSRSSIYKNYFEGKKNA